MNIAILYSEPTRRAKNSAYAAADEDTVVSAKKIAAAIASKGARSTLVALSEDRILETIQSLEADCIINLIDWTGSDLPLSLRAMDELTSRGIPFVGATRENFVLVDKVAMKQELDRFGFPTPSWQVFHTGKEEVKNSLKFPVIVKLAHEHCSVGIEKTSFVKDAVNLRAVVLDRISRFGQDVYAEEFLSGREFQITVLEQKTKPVMLPPAEIVYKASFSEEFLTFSERWNESDPEYERSTTVLAQLTQGELQTFAKLTTDVFVKLGFRDFTRIDCRYDEHKTLKILEANPNPGLDDDELYSMTISARAAGFTFPDFLWEMVASCLRREQP